MTTDEKLARAFLVADDILRRGPISGPKILDVTVMVDRRMPRDVVALGSMNGPIVVRVAG